MKFRLFLAIIVFAGGLSFVGAQEGSASSGKPEKLTEIPARLFQVQDASGFFWQAAGNGSITSGETQYLQSGLNLIVGGEPFAPSEAYVQGPGAAGDAVEVTFVEKRQDYEIRRNLWFDLERSAVRVMDSLRNTGKVSQTLPVLWRTTYPFPWQSLHGSNGEILASQPELALEDTDFGVVAHFSQPEGRHDTLFVLGSEKNGNDLGINGSSNLRELNFSREVTMKPGENPSFLYWIMQRNVSDLGGVSKEFSPFYQRSRLILPGITEKEAAAVINFPAEAFPSGSTSPNLRSLFSLNEIVDAIGLHRRGEDLLWISNTNQLGCKVATGESIRITSSVLGEVTIPMSDIAAIQGAASNGRTLVFLRDGQVFGGKLAEGKIPAKTDGSAEAGNLDVSDINLLLLASSARDGNPPEGATHFIETMGGEVIAVQAGDGTVWNAVTPWGSRSVPVRDIAELSYVSDPFPGHRLLTEDGTLLKVFATSDPLAISSVSGVELDLCACSIRRIWKAGALTRSVTDDTDDWIDFSEVPPEADRGGSFLLSGNNLLCGTLANGTIVLVEEGARIPLSVEKIQSFSRLHSSSQDMPPTFEFELSGGDRLQGLLEEPFLSVSHPSGSLRVPVATILAYRSPSRTP